MANPIVSTAQQNSKIDEISFHAKRAQLPVKRRHSHNWGWANFR